MSARHRPVVASARGLLLDGREVILAGSVDSVVADGTDLWALVDGRTVHRITATGADRVATLPAGPAGTCLARHRGATWVGGDEGRLWRVDGDRVVVVETFDRAPTHDGWHTPWGGPPSVLSMASDDRDLFVGVHVGGILRTSDDGATWRSTIDLRDDVHEVVIDGAGDLWAATGSGALAHSRDRGVTWSHHGQGLHGTYLLTVGAATDGVVVGASSGHAAADGVLYRYRAGRFERCAGGLPADLGGAVGPRRLAARGDLVVVALPTGELYRSDDGGGRWELVASGIEGATEVALRAG